MIRRRFSTKKLIGLMRSARAELSGTGVKIARSRHYLGWYGCPRIMEALILGEPAEMHVEGAPPVGADEDPWDPKWDQIYAEYRLAKVREEHYEPPLLAAAPSARVFLTWEIAALGVDPSGIVVDSEFTDEAQIKIDFEWSPSGDASDVRPCSIVYHHGPPQAAHLEELGLPEGARPVYLDAGDQGKPTAVVFFGDAMLKELSGYERHGLGNGITIYVAEPEEEEKPASQASAKKERKAAKAKSSSPAAPEDPIQATATALLSDDVANQLLSSGQFSWVREPLERLSEGETLSGKVRRNFRRLHNQIHHRVKQGLSNRLETDFLMKLADLSKDIDEQS